MPELSQQFLTASIEPADQPDIDRLLALSDAVAARLYPGEYRRPLTGAALARGDVSVLVARLEGKAVGCLALFDHGDGAVELKRMIIDPDHSGQGYGRALVRTALDVCLQRGISVVLLEVGIHNLEARKLYASMGFRDRGPFSPYQQTQVATFMECRLV